MRTGGQLTDQQVKASVGGVRRTDRPGAQEAHMFDSGGTRESVQASQASSARQDRRAQAVNQAQAAQAAGRGRRTISSRASSTRTDPSRKH